MQGKVMTDMKSRDTEKIVWETNAARKMRVPTFACVQWKSNDIKIKILGISSEIQDFQWP